MSVEEILSLFAIAGLTGLGLALATAYVAVFGGRAVDRLARWLRDGRPSS